MGKAEVKTKRWWQTLPAILTALTGLIGAVTTLLVFLWPSGLPEHPNPRADAAVAEPDEPTYDPSVQFHAERGHWDQAVPLEL